MTELVSGPVRHLVYNSKKASDRSELRWWIRCNGGHLMMIDRDQAYGKKAIFCIDCSSNFVEDFSRRIGFKPNIANATT